MRHLTNNTTQGSFLGGAVSQKSSYKELNARLKFPTNPAYCKPSKWDVNLAEDQRTLLDFCREQNIPFNDTDKLLYKLQQSKDNYEIYRVIFDSLTNNNKPFVAAKGMLSSPQN